MHRTARIKTSRYTYKHSNLEFAPHPYVPGDRVYKTSHDDPNTAIVVETTIDGESMSVDIVYIGLLEDENVDTEGYLSHCLDSDIKRYTYDATQIDFVETES